MVRRSTRLALVIILSVLGHDQLLADDLSEAAAESTHTNSTQALSVPSGDTEYVPKWYSMITNVPGDWLRFSRQTFRTENVVPFLGLTALTGVLIATDDQTWRASRRWYHESTFIKNTSEFFEYMGDGRPQFGLAGGFALYGFAMRDRRALRTSSQIVEAILSCGAVIQVIKHITGRESPFVSTAPGGVWDFFPNQIDYHKRVPHFDAYPSGHIATALTTITVVAENYPEWKWVRPLGYPIVAIIGISMANTGIHWYSDYPLGLVLGYSFGMLAAHPEPTPNSNTETHSETGFSFFPMVTNRGTGVTAMLSF